MKIAVVSDTHDNVRAISTFCLEVQIRGVDLILHAGDVISPFAARALLKPSIPIRCVFGNNDGEREGLRAIFLNAGEIVTPPLKFEMGGRIYFMVHDILPFHRDLETLKPDVVISGHTHEVDVKHGGKRLYINPGEACGWLSGRHTFVLFDTEKNMTEIIEMEV